jgi:hypothetical protein
VKPVKGLATMKYEKDAAPAKAKAAPVSGKKKALTECVAALKDGDVDGAAAALGAAVTACMAEYEEGEE